MGQKLFIGTSGSVTTLRAAKGKGVQLHTVGKTENPRVSEIVWSDELQQWTIVFLSESIFKGLVRWVTKEVIEVTDAPEYDLGDTPLQDWRINHASSMMSMSNKASKDCEINEPLLFDSYEEAVKEEIRLINMARSKFGSSVI